MGKNRKFLSLIILPVVIVAVLLVAGCSSNGEPQPSAGNRWTTSSSLTQTNSGGAVDIQVRWEADQANVLVFEVSMNTHSVDLDKVDLKQLAVLHDSQGNEFKPLSWESQPGGHHRSGRLTFAIPDSLKENSTEFLHMAIKNVAGVSERGLQWNLG